MIFMSLYFMYSVEKSWFEMEVVCFSLGITSLIISFGMPESPKYLLSKGLISEAI